MSKNWSIGTWCELPCVELTHVLAKSGLDFVILDMEHSVFTFETIQQSVYAAHCEGMKALVRVSEISEAQVKRALDTGADGVVFHKVKNMEDIKKVIEYSKFPPLGRRGFNPYISACGYGPVNATFFEEQNRKTQVVVILENREVFEYIHQIVECTEIDALYIGQYDLSVAFGVPGETNHPRVLECINCVLELVPRTNKQVGCMVHSTEEAIQMMDKGINFLVYKTDTNVLLSTYQKFIQGVNENEII